MSVGVETRSPLTGCAEFGSAEGIVEALVGVGGGCREAKGTGSPLVERLWGKHRNMLLSHMVRVHFNLRRNFQTVFQGDCMILHAHQQCMGIPILPQPHQHLLVFKISTTQVL